MSARTEHWAQVVGIAAGAFLVLAAIFGWSNPASAYTSNWSATMTEWNEGTIIVEDGDMACAGTDWYAAEVANNEIGGFLLASPQQGAGFPVTIQTDPTEGSWIDTVAICTDEAPCLLNVIAQCNDSEEDLIMGLYDDTLIVDVFRLPAFIWYTQDLLMGGGTALSDLLLGALNGIFVLLAVIAGIVLVSNFFRRLGR